MTLILKPGTDWATVSDLARHRAPEAFDTDRIRNLIGGDWRAVGTTGEHVSPVDQSPILGPARVDHDTAVAAVADAVRQHRDWGGVPLEERAARVRAALDGLRDNRDAIAMLLVWEIGKPWKIACADIDRCIEGVEWYLGQIGRQLEGRRPLAGPISNIASWNYPLSVLVHAELVQLLAGNAVIAKTPSQGGFHALTLAHAMMARAGLPVTLLSGVGGELADALVSSPSLGALAFVGGRSNGRAAAQTLANFNKRHILEQEGLNAWGIWDYSNWDDLAPILRKGFEYAKQRCTAYPRYVVQRRLFPAFLEMYLSVIGNLRFGHPLAVEDPADELPELEFGPVIQKVKATDLRAQYDEAITMGGIPLYHGDLSKGKFLTGQDIAAYVAPACVLEPPRAWSLHHSEPFGPIDSIVLVDTEAEFISAMNVSNGSLVSSVATDDRAFAARVREEVHSFKFGINRPRSRGDREEVFGGRGASWRGAFVGGDLLVDSVTDGERPLFGNFPDGARYPDTLDD
ncbi:aldehyde dehydrogenase family protein [Lacisediminihabitans sp. H27-G8]|uniref:aldehyde dehydrogenase family protein n=1 Tax=Lacisediminihabitans sp. H27-G8 TaxID=3111909 RepID=UPI0038FC27D5